MKIYKQIRVNKFLPLLFFLVIFGICLLAAKLLYWFLDSVGLIHKRVKPLSQPQV